MNPSLGKVKKIANALDIDYSILSPIEKIKELDLIETKFEFFIETHCKGLMYDNAPKEVQDKIRNLFEQCEIIDSLVETKQVEKEFDNPVTIASIFYDYISRQKVEYENSIKEKEKTIKRYEDIMDKILSVHNEKS